LHKKRLRALGDHKFPMPYNTTGIAGTYRELLADVVETVPPWKKKLFGSKHVFDQLFYFYFYVITALTSMACTPES